jgi:hypothetical protein
MKAPTLRRTVEVAWFAAAEQAEGPYSPISGPTTILHCGTLKALQSLGIDTLNIVPGDLSRVYRTTGEDGLAWTVRWAGEPFWFAFRDRTDEEIIAEIEEGGDSIYRQLRKSTLLALRRVTDEMVSLGESLRPESCPSRSERRQLKARLLSLAKLQEDLAYCDPPGRFTRERMAMLGLGPQHFDYARRLDAQY